MPTRFGPQPIREVVWRKGLTFGEFAASTAIRPHGHVLLAMAGRVPPNEALRRIAPAMLGVPLEQLFTCESLEATCRPLAPSHRRRLGVHS